jgi:hypothetical protein
VVLDSTGGTNEFAPIVQYLGTKSWAVGRASQRGGGRDGGGVRDRDREGFHEREEEGTVVRE